MAGCKCKSEVACSIGTFNPEERIRYDEIRNELTAIQSVEEIVNGYTFIYPNQASLLMKIAEWISYENRCCPFINFSLYVSGEADTIRVELTGDEEVKSLLREEFNIV